MGRRKAYQYRGYPSGGSSSGLFVRTKEPDGDWEAIRLAKIRCEERCGEFNDVLGGCGLALEPSITCVKFRYCRKADDEDASYVVDVMQPMAPFRSRREQR